MPCQRQASRCEQAGVLYRARQGKREGGGKGMIGGMQVGFEVSRILFRTHVTDNTLRVAALYSVPRFTGAVAPCRYLAQSLRLALMTQRRQSMSVHPMATSDRRSPFIKT